MKGTTRVAAVVIFTFQPGSWELTAALDKISDARFGRVNELL
jgi:hypothetical protein